jgi:hypothetical protein
LTYRKGFGVGYGDNYYGDIAWADRYARCCPGAADNVNASGACVSSRVGAPSAPLINYSIAMVAGGGGNDTYSVPWGDGLTTDGWLECDYYANATGGDSGWCSSVCPGGFVLAGEAGVGEYEPASVSNGGRSDMGSNAYGYAECCGDDANEYYKQAKWGGVNYSSCCNNATDYVNESSMCRPSCVDCGGQNKIDSSGVCTNPDANTTSGKYVCETCWSKNHSLGRFWVWDPLVNSTRDCCGDDANEEYLHTRGYDGGLFDVAWGNVTGDDSCCFGNLNDGRCVFGHKCFNGSIGGGQFVYLVAPDILEAVVGCNGTSRT